jgi:outer membrane protein assembly factor BamB
VLIGDRLIVGNRNGLLAALNPATGEVIWRALFWGSSVESDPVPGEGTLFYIGSSDLRRVSLIDAKDARVVWRTDIYGVAWPRPAVSDKMVYAAAMGFAPYQMRHLGGLSALDRQSGKIVWRWPMPEWPGSLVNGFLASPVIDGKTLVIGGLDGTLYAFPVE